MDNYQNEVHHLQFLDNEGDLPASITILVRHKNKKTSKQKERVITTDDLIDLHQELKRYKGDIKLFLKK